MLSDPTTIKGISLAAHTTISVSTSDSYATIDVAPGKSVRKCSSSAVSGGPATLTISHSVSNDNKPAKTDRALVRIDYLVKDSEGREMNAYAYAVIGIPRGATMYNSQDEFESIMVVQSLIGALSGITASALDETRITRVLAGEP